MARANDAELRAVLSKLAISRGVVSILFGIFALVWPGITLVTFGVILSIWLLVSGAVSLVSSILTHKKNTHWVFHMVVGLLQLAVGAYLVQRPAVTIATIVALVSIALVVEGVVGVIVAFVDSNSDNRVMSVIGGALGILAGIIIWRYPVTGSLAFVWVLGLYALVLGSFAVAAGAAIDN